MAENKALPEYALELQRKVKELGLSINEAARQADINEATFRGIYHGQRKSIEDISLRKRKRIYGTFGIKSYYSPLFEPVDLEKDDRRVQLWKYILNNHDGMPSEFAKRCGIEAQTVSIFLAGRTDKMIKEREKVIYKVTGIEGFRTEGQKRVSLAEDKKETSIDKTLGHGVLEERLDAIHSEIKELRDKLNGKVQDRRFNEQDYAEHVKNTFYALTYALESIRDNREAIKRVKEMIPYEHIANFSSYLNSLYKAEGMMEFVPRLPLKLGGKK